MRKPRRPDLASPVAQGRSQELVRQFLEHTPAAVAMFDREMRYLFATRRWLSDFRLGERSIIGRSHYEVFPEIPERWKEVHRRCLAGAVERCEEDSFQRADGTTDWTRWEVVPWRDDSGAVGGILMFTEMITERKAAEEALRREVAARQRSEGELGAQRKFLRRVIDADPHLVFAKDWDGKFTLLNQAVADIYGTTVENLIGKGDSDFNSNREEVEHFLRDDQEVMLSGRAKFIPEEPVTDARTGVTRWFETVKIPLISSEGASRQVLGVATDITQRRLLEEQFRQAQKMEAVGRLAGGVAHDFNNLLTAISGYAELLLHDLSPSDGRRADVLEIRDAAERATKLTRQLLAFGRQQVLRPEVLDLNTTVTDMSSLLRRVIGEDIELCTALSPSLDPVLADRGQLEQVLMNLAVNARDAMPRGGRLTIETAEVDGAEAFPGESGPRVASPCIRLAVTDTGVGMSAATQSHLFEPFFTTKGPGRGTGLGLATVYGIVKQSGGNIGVYSEEGRGTTFRIYLPRTQEPVVLAGERSPEPRDLRGTETVLVVEDAEAVRVLAVKVLESLGYRVLSAADGAEALDLVEGVAPLDLVLTDVVMPGMNGKRLADRLAELCPGVKALFMSGYAQSAIVHQGVLEAGIAYLQKPFTPEGLARRVREVLDAR